jgi:hypothetical protein
MSKQVSIKNKFCQAWWLTAVIPDTEGAEIRRVAV